MSQATRELVCSKLVFQNPSQKADLLNPAVTNSGLIALLQYLVVSLGWHLEITAVYTDHHVDGDGPGLHRPAGLAFDGWPLNSAKPGDYMDENSAQFQEFLTDLSRAPYYYDTGLGGSSFTPANMKAAGPSAFQDSQFDHVHGGARAA